MPYDLHFSDTTVLKADPHLMMFFYTTTVRMSSRLSTAWLQNTNYAAAGFPPLSARVTAHWLTTSASIIGILKAPGPPAESEGVTEIAVRSIRHQKLNLRLSSWSSNHSVSSSSIKHTPDWNHPSSRWTVPYLISQFQPPVCSRPVQRLFFLQPAETFS
jgi:hypothetical protein